MRHGYQGKRVPIRRAARQHFRADHAATARPVFDDQGRMVLSLTAIGPSGSFDLDLEGAMALSLKRSGLELSRQLGWRPA